MSCGVPSQYHYEGANFVISGQCYGCHVLPVVKVVYQSKRKLKKKRKDENDPQELVRGEDGIQATQKDVENSSEVEKRSNEFAGDDDDDDDDDGGDWDWDRGW